MLDTGYVVVPVVPQWLILCVPEDPPLGCKQRHKILLYFLRGEHQSEVIPSTDLFQASRQQGLCLAPAELYYFTAI